MNKSTREQKSLYLAFALTTSIQFHTLHDEYQSTDTKYCLNLCKGQEIISKSKTFGIDQMIKETEMYLYLILTHFENLSQDEYSIKITQQKQNEINIIYDEQINLEHYLQDHQKTNKDFWTEISPSVQTDKFVMVLKKRVFMKKTRFQLDDIINSEETGQQHDTVFGLDHSPTLPKVSKFGIDKRKSRSLQSSLGCFSPLPPRRLDTISEEESTIPMTEKKDKQKQEFIFNSESNGKYKPRQRFSQGLKQNQQGFQSALKRQSTWIQKNGNCDIFDELVNAFQHSATTDIQANIEQFNKKQQEQISLFKKNKSKKSLQSQFSKINSKSSKLTKTSQHQDDQNEVSFLDKSSLLLDLQKSQLNITPDQEVCFKLKWILLLIVVLALAVFSSLSTDAFDLTDSHKNKAKKSKKSVKTNKQAHSKKQEVKNQQKTKSNKNKPKKQTIHA